MIWPDLRRRSTQPEWMDGADVSLEIYAACVTDLAKVNTVTLARRPTLAWLGRATAGLQPGAAFSLLDVGFGDGDMLRAIARWARRGGLLADLRGVDLNWRSEAVAARKTDPLLPITYATGDAYADRRPVDFIISSLVTHHMEDDEVVRFLAWMERTAGRGWFVNDLHRRRAPHLGFRVLAAAAGWDPFVRHDGPVSIARSFRPEDWRALAEAAGLSDVPVEIRRRFPYRLCVGRLR